MYTMLWNFDKILRYTGMSIFLHPYLVHKEIRFYLFVFGCF